MRKSETEENEETDTCPGYTPQQTTNQQVFEQFKKILGTTSHRRREPTTSQTQTSFL